METKFTPGPWEVENHRDKGDWRTSGPIWARNKGCCHPGTRVCSVNWDNLGSHDDPNEIAEREANANLIANSPTMFDLLRRFVDIYSNTKMPDHLQLLQLRDEAHDVLLKARGESNG